MILEADLFPHNRRGGGNTGDITKTSCCDRLHVFSVIIQFPDKIYQCGRDDMWEMADTGGDEIVFFTGEEPSGSNQESRLVQKIR